ncbi:MAG: hypothetical protein LBQ66_08555 [Planctomycetaceae bacterium]|jgi:hypothetical protein|nr:hypothetical protein [Planctomycetaceae bacterium]
MFKIFFFRKLFSRRLGEPLAFFVIFVVGFIFFLVHLNGWVIPQLTFWQEFIQSKGKVLETRVLDKEVGGRRFYSPEVLLQIQVQSQSDPDNFAKSREVVTHQVWAFNEKRLIAGGDFSYDQERALELIDRFRVGEVVDCWYRVGDPLSVVVYWQFSFSGWFFLVLSFTLVLVGLIGFGFSFRLRLVSAERQIVLAGDVNNSPIVGLVGDMRSSAWSTIPDIKIINESPGTRLAFRLPLGNKPIFPLVGLTLLTIAWLVVAAAIVIHSTVVPVSDWYDIVGGTIFRMLFLSVGLFLLFIVVRRHILTFGAGLTLLEISDHPIYPGRRYRLLLIVSGVLQFHDLSVVVVCEEVARFRQGTDTATNRRDVFRQIIFRKKDFDTSADTPLSEEFFVQLPVGAMHSFRRENNEICWKIVIVANIAGWSAPVQKECPIVVRPIIWNDTTPDDSPSIY